MNQYDNTQLSAVIAYLKHTHHIPSILIKREWGLVFSGTSYGLFSHVSQDILKHMSVNRPDIILLDKSGTRVRLIIEYDGPNHYRVRTRLQKTIRRNERYARAGIPFAAINAEKLNKSGITLFSHIDMLLRRHQ